MFKIAATTTLVTLVGYFYYFDYKRRTSKEFRKYLRQQNKLASETFSDYGNNYQTETVPTTQKEIEEYFMLNLQQGEQLMLQGPNYYNIASEHFLKALKVYPDPQKLLQVLGQSLPKEVSEMIVLKMQNEVQSATIEEIE